MVIALNPYTQGLSAQNLSAIIVKNTVEKDSNSSGQASKNTFDNADTVEISAEARKFLQAEEAKNAVSNAKVAYYEQFRPTREGFSARNLASGIVDPGAQPFSQNRSFSEVAQAARENMDSKYQQMRDSGKPFDYDSYEGQDWNSLMGDLDRRALYAVSSNEGGSFTQQEQEMARTLMNGQQGMAMGLYNGPTRLFDKVGASFNRMDFEKSNIDGMRFLDSVSIEEKATSVEWASQRAILQNNYEDEVTSHGGVPKDFSTDNPLSNLIKSAIYAWFHSESPGFSDGDLSSVEELRNETWFADYSDSLDSAIAQTRELYGLK